MHIHEIGSRFYTQRLHWGSDRPPLLHLDQTYETEPPYRRGRCLVVRIPFTRAAHVFGVWVESLPEQEALLAGIGGRITSDNGCSLNDVDEWL